MTNILDSTLIFKVAESFSEDFEKEEISSKEFLTDVLLSLLELPPDEAVLIQELALILKSVRGERNLAWKSLLLVH